MNITNEQTMKTKPKITKNKTNKERIINALSVIVFELSISETFFILSSV
jgi:hypothetical protein